MVWYLVQKWAGANTRFQTIAGVRLLAWARTGTASRRRPHRTPRQTRLLTALRAARAAAALITRIDVDP